MQNGSAAAVLYKTLVNIFAFPVIYPWPVFALHLLLPVPAHAWNFFVFAYNLNHAILIIEICYCK